MAETPSILYLMPGNVAGGPLGAGEISRRRTLLQACLGTAARAEVWDLPEGPHSIESFEDEARAVPPTIARVREAEAAGFRSVIIGCFGDTALDRAGAAVRIPVVGPAQASMRHAVTLGARFSIVTVVQTVVPMIARLIEVYGMRARLASIRVVDTPVLALRHDGEENLRRMLVESRTALDKDGANCIVLGCMSMAFQPGVSALLQEKLGAPVVNPLHAAVTEALGRVDPRSSLVEFSGRSHET